MKMPKRALRRLLLFTAAVGSLWLTTGLFRNSWNPAVLVFDLLDYVDAERGMAPACDCASILEGDAEEIEKAKLLMLHRDFPKSVRISDEDYINATQDCQYDQ